MTGRRDRSTDTAERKGDYAVSVKMIMPSRVWWTAWREGLMAEF